MQRCVLVFIVRRKPYVIAAIIAFALLLKASLYFEIGLFEVPECANLTARSIQKTFKIQIKITSVIPTNMEIDYLLTNPTSLQPDPCLAGGQRHFRAGISLLDPQFPDRHPAIRHSGLLQSENRAAAPEAASDDSHWCQPTMDHGD